MTHLAVLSSAGRLLIIDLSELPNLNPVSTSRIVDQIKQRKLLWSKPAEATEVAEGSGVLSAPAAESSGKSSPEKPRQGCLQHWAKATFRGEAFRRVAERTGFPFFRADFVENKTEILL